MDLKLKKLKLRSIRFPIPEKPDKGEETEVTLLEAESEKLLNCADMTAQEMQEFYPQLLHPADPDQMDKAVEGKVNSLRRATFNLAKTYLKTYEISDELGARWKDAKPARRKRKRRLISPAPANALIDLGCDVICQYVNTTGPQTAAQERGVWGLGSDYDMTEFAPDAHLFAACMNWGAIYTKLVSTIVNGEFHGGLIYGDVADGTLYLTPFSKNVADGTQEAVQAAMDKMVSGEWDVFQQDVYDVDGNLVPAATFTDDYLYSGMTDLLVKGVVAK